MNRILIILSIPSLLFIIPVKTSGQQPTFDINVDLSKPTGPMKPIWSYFGYDEPNYTTRKDGSKLLTELSQLSNHAVYVRTHNLLTTGDGTPALKWGSTNAYTEDEKGRPVYNWKIVDSIFDAFIKRGMKPIAEIGFMPKALSVKPDPYQHHWSPSAKYNEIYTGWAYPPKDYNKWRELVYQWVKHCVQRYGKQEVSSWWWEVWNEPDIGYWQGTQEEYLKLYDYAADGLKKALPTARIGGPTTTSPRSKKANAYLQRFLEHCDTGVNYATGRKGAPLDYITFHAKGNPKFLENQVRMDMSVQLQDVNNGFKTIAASHFKNLPVMIGECDPEGCAACSVNYNPQNAYRNGSMYSSYTASMYARLYELAQEAGINLIGAVTWAFEFEDQPWFAGFRDLATNGVDKPVLNVFRMFGKMQGGRVEVENNKGLSAQTIYTNGVHGLLPDVQALASRSSRKAWVMLWNYYDDDLSGPDAFVNLSVSNIPSKKIIIKEYRVDKQNSNSYTVWKKIGSPQQVRPGQFKTLEANAKLKQLGEVKTVLLNSGKFHSEMQVPAQSVSLLEFSW
jgi:xylan 1,4-beta-xylosidase